MSHTGVSYEIDLHVPHNRKIIVDTIETVCREHIDEFDGFVISGYSMSIIGSILADRLNKNLSVVRKNGDERCSWHNVEGPHNKQWIFLDDMVSSGRTLFRCSDGLKSINGQIIAVILWSSFNEGKTITINNGDTTNTFVNWPVNVDTNSFTRIK